MVERVGAIVAAGVLAAGLAGCGGGEREAEEPAAQQQRGTPEVYVTFYPLEFFTERIAGGEVEVVNPVPPEADPATFQPDDATLAAYQGADLIVVNGAGFEQWLEVASLPESRIVDTTAGLGEDELIYLEGVTHSHGPGGEHTHEGLDGHTWLDPQIAARQAGEVARALAGLLPERAELFERNLGELEEQLARLDGELEGLTPRVQGAFLMASHPAYNYLAQRYGWEVHNLGLEPDAPLSDEAIAEVEAAVAEAPAGAVRILLWEEPPLDETGQALAERFDIRGVTFRPAESLEPAARESENYLSVMHANARRLREALEGEGAGPGAGEASGAAAGGG